MEDLVPFLIVLFYIFSYLRGLVAKQKADPGPTAESPSDTREAPVSTVEAMLQEMRRQMAEAAGERGSPGEHSRSPGEHRTTASEHRPTASEQRPVLSDHLQTASEIEFSQSEHVVQASEHEMTLGEHQKGDAWVPTVPISLPATAGHRRSKFGKALIQDLKGGHLGRAVVLREILSPPVSLRSRSDRTV